MSKLYFRYGAMGSAKSMNLIAVAHNYRKQGKEVYVVRAVPSGWLPGVTQIESRCGLTYAVDCVFPYDVYETESFVSVHESIIITLLTRAESMCCVLVDEAQFLPTRAVDFLRDIATAGTPVICYGLRADFRSRLFEGSKRLLEVADSIEEVKTTCSYCERKATQNLRLVDSEEQVLVGGDAEYAAACWECFSGRRRT